MFPPTETVKFECALCVSSDYSKEDVPDKRTNSQTDRQTDIHTDRQTDRQPDRQTDRQTV